MVIDVTQPLTELDGKTPITQEVRCEGCLQVYRKIYELLSTEARSELEAHKKEILDIVTREPEQMTPRLAINRALMQPMEDDELKPEMMVARLNLATRIYKNDEVEFAPEEAIIIKERIVKMYQLPLISARICLLVDPTMSK